MKIIEQRKPFEGWKLEVVCNGEGWDQDDIPCTSILEIDSNDIVKREWTKSPCIEGIDYGFICPVCGCFTELDKSKLNNNLMKNAKPYK